MSNGNKKQSIQESVDQDSMDTYGSGWSLKSHQRSATAISTCRDSLNSLRKVVKSVKSHREKSAQLLSVAADAVLEVEELNEWIHADQELSQDQERAIIKLTTKLNVIIDECEALVNIYGNMSSFDKIFKSSNDVSTRFEEVASRLKAVGAAARNMRFAANNSVGTSYSRQENESTEKESSIMKEPIGITSSTSDPSVLASVESAGHSSDSNQFSPAKKQITMLHADYPNNKTIADTNESSRYAMPGNEIKSLRKSSRIDRITALAYINPESSEGSSGTLWYYIGRTFSSDKFLVLDLSSGARTHIHTGEIDSAVTVIHIDYRGDRIWTGHKSGSVMVWNHSQRAPICSPLRITGNSAITALTTDEEQILWVGTRRGDVRKVKLEHFLTDEGAVLGTSLVDQGSLRHQNTGKHERIPDAEVDHFGMVIHPKAREKAHEGPVTALAATVGRVWTSGGGTAFVCLREWTQRGEFIAKHDLKAIGGTSCMMLTSPIVRVTRPSDSVSGLFTMPSSRSSSVVKPNLNNEVPQAWQLISGHTSGIFQVWGDVSGVIRPLLRIGRRDSPVTGLTVCANMGIICSSHLDGKVKVLAIPDVKSDGAFPSLLGDRSVASVNPKFGELRISDTGIARMDGGDSGIVTTNVDASVSFAPVARLRTACEEVSSDIQDKDALVPRVEHLDAFAARLEASDLAAQEKLEMINQKKSRNISGEFSRSFTRRASVRGHGSKKTQDWTIDFNDLVLERVIGQGGFGTVYVGHETEVAIKVFQSIESLGLESADVASRTNESGTQAESDAIKTLQREEQLLTAIRHPNVILFLGVCTRPPCVVTEYCEHGSLFDLLKNAKEDSNLAEALSWKRRILIAREAAQGMLYLHSHKPNIIHRDLKSPNLLIDRDWHAKVTDFGLSRLSDKASVASSVKANNPIWQAPEIIVSNDYTKAGDVYAFGLILWELITWEVPFTGMSQFQIMVAVGHQGYRPDIPSVESDKFIGGAFPGWEKYVKLLKDCWAQNQDDRPNFSSIVQILRDISKEVISDNRLSLHMGASTATEANNGGNGCYAVDNHLGEEQHNSEDLGNVDNDIKCDKAFSSPEAVVETPVSPFDAPSEAAVVKPPASPFDAPSEAVVVKPPVSPFDAPSEAVVVKPPVSPFDAPSEAVVVKPPVSPFDAPA